MATGNEKKLRMDDFISALRPDPKSKGDPLIIIEGFIHKSNERGYVRVYFDEELNNFVDIAEKDIKYAVELPKDVSPMGGSKLWVNANAVYLYGDPSKAERPKGSFLQGELMKAYEQQFEAAGVPPTAEYISYPNGFCGATKLPGVCAMTPPMTVRTLFMATCFVTCPPKSCMLTICKPTCFITCPQVSCRLTICRPTCISCFKTCFRTCFCEIPPIEITQITPTIYQGVIGGVNPYTGTGFEGFNPYMGY